MTTMTPRKSIISVMTPPAGSRRHFADSPFKAQPVQPVELYEVGDRVSHDVYGMGRVIAVEDGRAVAVDFGTSRMRIKSPFTKLFKL